MESNGERKPHIEYGERHYAKFLLVKDAINPRDYSTGSVRILCMTEKPLPPLGDEQFETREALEEASQRPGLFRRPLFPYYWGRTLHLSMRPFDPDVTVRRAPGYVVCDMHRLRKAVPSANRAYAERLMEEELEAYEAWLRGECFDVEYYDSQTNELVDTETGYYGYVETVQGSLQHLDELDAK